MQCQVKKGEDTIRNPKESSSWLIAFRDFLIHEDCLSKKNSRAKIGGRYERPNSDICPDRKTFLAGNYKSLYFQVSEFEVYQVPERKL